MGLRRADRSRVERDIEQLTQEDQELVLRLVRKEESRK
jgi:hypothetical protein